MTMPNKSDPAVNAQSKLTVIYAISIVSPALSVLIVSLRFYTRHYILNRIGLDDKVILVAVVRSLHLRVSRYCDETNCHFQVLAIGLSVQVLLGITISTP